MSALAEMVQNCRGPCAIPASAGASILHFPQQHGRPIMERLFEASSMALCVLDPVLRIVMANEAAGSILESRATDLVGRSILDLLPAAEPILRDYLELVAKDEALPDHQVAWRDRHYHLSFGVTRDREGMLSEIFVAALDVTRRVKLEWRLREARRRLVATSRRDHLTGLLNRRGFESVLYRELRRARRERVPLSMVSIDIDWFKAYNDTLGHPQGDKCLRLVAAAVRASLRRAGDAASRHGGEEFILILPNTNVGGAMTAADNFRRALDGLDILHPGSPKERVTASIGIATTVPDVANGAVASEAAALLGAADRALYRAKNNGRDRVEVAGPYDRLPT